MPLSDFSAVYGLHVLHGLLPVSRAAFLVGKYTEFFFFRDFANLHVGLWNTLLFFEAMKPLITGWAAAGGAVCFLAAVPVGVSAGALEIGVCLPGS